MSGRVSSGPRPAPGRRPPVRGWFSLPTWLAVHGGLSLLWTVLLWVPSTRGAASVGVIAHGAAAFTVLMAGFGREAVRPANAVTLLRLLLGLAALGMGLLRPALRGSAFIFAMLLAAELTDFLDGFLARRLGATPFGAIWDMEVDAYFMLLLSAVVVSFQGFAPWILLMGAMRYAFFFLFLPLPDVERPPAVFRWYAKAACAAGAGTLVGITFPFAGQRAKAVAGLVALSLLSVSFLWEAALKLRRRGKP